MDTIKKFFTDMFSGWGLVLTALGGIAAYFFAVNDFSRPPIPDPATPRDYSKDLEKLDPSKPIGVFVFNVDHSKHDGWIKYTTFGVNAARNNYKEEMEKYYGSNMVFIDNPGPGHISQFVRDFNAKFGARKPEVHFVANHHQNTYDDNKLAEAIASFQTSSTRALIFSCGPVSKAYEKAGIDYVIIPAPDGMGLGPELSLEFTPAYRNAIGVLATTSDPEEVRKKFAERNFYNMAQEWMHGRSINSTISGEPPTGGQYNTPIVVEPPKDGPTPQAGLPSKPQPAQSVNTPER